MTPADKLREAARRARDGRAFTDESFGELLAAWLEAEADRIEPLTKRALPGYVLAKIPALALADALGGETE